jgi:hypothetical protein
MNTQLASLPENHVQLLAHGYCQNPPLPHRECAEWEQNRWSDPVLAPITATLLNLPCASARQLRDLTGLPYDLVKSTLVTASQAPRHSRLVAPIGVITCTDTIDSDLQPFITRERLWAIVPEAAKKLRKMPMVPTDLPPLKERGIFNNEPSRGSLLTSEGAFVRVRDLIHVELTSYLAWLAQHWYQQRASILILHEPLLREAFGWM